MSYNNTAVTQQILKWILFGVRSSQAPALLEGFSGYTERCGPPWLAGSGGSAPVEEQQYLLKCKLVLVWTFCFMLQLYVMVRVSKSPAQARQLRPRGHK